MTAPGALLAVLFLPRTRRWGEHARRPNQRRGVCSAHEPCLAQARR